MLRNPKVKKMLWKAAMFAVLGFFCYFIMEYRAWLDIDRVIYSKSPGPCKTLLAGGGSEDFADLDEDTILVSSGVNTLGLPGKIYGLYTNGTLVEAKVVDKVNGESPLLGAHGLSVWEDPITGISWLYVVIHALTEEGVAVFEVDKSPLTLKYIKTIKDLAFSGFMNDLVVVAKDTFYITKFIHLRSLVGFVLELGLCLPTGKLIYFDGTSAKTVKSGFVLANGIAISKDKRTLYVSDTGRKRVHVLNIRSNGDVETASVIDIGTSPDNLIVDPVSGDLWIGACPKLITVLSVNGIFGNHPPVAQVLRIRLVNKNVVDIEEVYSNNGSVVSGSSVALYKNKKLFIGTISSQLVMCDVNYLQDW